jgi:transcriptional regulator of arginine metabolism
MEKQKRQMAIKQIVTTKPFGTQEELCKELGRIGFTVTQATLSRDLRELGVVRLTMTDGMRYALHTESEDRRMAAFLGYEIESLDANESIIVVRTLPGRAQGVAEVIDSLHFPEVLGTLAGDNTIFITPRSIKKIQGLMKNLKNLMTQHQQVA